MRAEERAQTSGFIDVNKPSGMSSAAAVSKVRRASGQACGHMGTLDPLASGVLPVAVGNASRLFRYLLDKQKVYLARFRFGIETDTLDVCGEVLRSGLPVPDEGALRAALPAFVGEIEQIPPAYSAKSVNGVRAYRLARQGKAVELAPRRVRIDGIEWCGQTGEDEFSFRIACGGGTYIRSLGRDLAAACGTVAAMSSLVREQSGVFSLADAVAPDALTSDNWRGFLIPPETAFSMPELRFAGDEARRLGFGQRLPFAGAAGEYKLWLDGAFYGIALAENGVVCAKVKLV